MPTASSQSQAGEWTVGMGNRDDGEMWEGCYDLWVEVEVEVEVAGGTDSDIVSTRSVIRSSFFVLHSSHGSASGPSRGADYASPPSALQPTIPAP